MLPSPRFLLVLSTESNLLRAALFTRELKNVASARQTFQLVQTEDGGQEFDPAEVWYKMKKVIAACLDIGRTLSREIAGVAIVGTDHARVMWSRQGDEVVSRGRIGSENTRPDDSSVPEFSGTLADWLWWNLTGGMTARHGSEFGKTRARSPFDAELPVLAVLDVTAGKVMSSDGQGGAPNDSVLEAAGMVWRKL